MLKFFVGLTVGLLLGLLLGALVVRSVINPTRTETAEFSASRDRALVNLYFATGHDDALPTSLDLRYRVKTTLGAAIGLAREMCHAHATARKAQAHGSFASLGDATANSKRILAMTNGYAALTLMYEIFMRDFQDTPGTEGFPSNLPSTIGECPALQ